MAVSAMLGHGRDARGTYRVGPSAGVAQWQSASPVRTKPAFDSRRRLQDMGVRCYGWHTRLLPDEVRVKIPPLPPGFARLAQMGYERSPYKREVPESQAGPGTRFGRVVITGALRSCKPEVGIRLPPRPPD